MREPADLAARGAGPHPGESSVAHREPIACVFCRAPVPGRAKTRLAATLGGEAAAALSTALLLDVVDALRSGGLVVRAAVAGSADVGPVTALMPGGVPVSTQPAGDLGARMVGVASAVLSEHAAPVALVGADAVLIRPEHVRLAGRALAEGADAAICPASDGGYSLIAIARPIRTLFEGVPWGSHTVVAATRARAKEAGLRVAEVGALEDVDRSEDLARLSRLLEHAGTPSPAPRTRHLLSALAGGEALRLGPVPRPG